MALGWRGSYYRYKALFLNVLAVYRQKPDLRMFMEVLLSAATISFFAVFAIRPTLLTIVDLVNQLKTREETLAKMTKKIKDLDTAQSLFRSQESALALVGDAVPTTPVPDLFARQIEGLTKTTSTKLLGVSISEVTLIGEAKGNAKKTDFSPMPEGAKEVAFSVSVEGDYQTLAAFLNSLENLRRPVKIDVFNISSAKTDEGNSLVLVISGRVPYYGT